MCSKTKFHSSIYKVQNLVRRDYSIRIHAHTHTYTRRPDCTHEHTDYTKLNVYTT